MGKAKLTTPSTTAQDLPQPGSSDLSPTSSGSLKKESELWPRAWTHTSGQCLAAALSQEKARAGVFRASGSGILHNSLLQMLKTLCGFKKTSERGKKIEKKREKNCCRVPKSIDTTSGVGRPEATDSWRPGEHPAEAAQHAHPVWRCFPGCLPLTAGTGGPSARPGAANLFHVKLSTSGPTETLESPVPPQDWAAGDKNLLCRSQAPLGAAGCCSCGVFRAWGTA